MSDNESSKFTKNNSDFAYTKLLLMLLIKYSYQTDYSVGLTNYEISIPLPHY